jgi:hypothetical protein
MASKKRIVEVLSASLDDLSEDPTFVELGVQAAFRICQETKQIKMETASRLLKTFEAKYKGEALALLGSINCGRIGSGAIEVLGPVAWCPLIGELLRTASEVEPGSFDVDWKREFEKLQAKYDLLAEERKGSKGKLIGFDSLVDHFAANSLPIRASASSINLDSEKPENALTKGTEKAFCSKDIPGSWLALDFGVEVVLDAYRLLRSPRGSSLLSWDFEVSEDGKAWTLADRQRDLPKPTDWSREFLPLSSPQKCKFARVTMVGPRYFGDNHLVIYEIDFKGSIRAP